MLEDKKNWALGSPYVRGSADEQNSSITTEKESGTRSAPCPSCHQTFLGSVIESHDAQHQMQSLISLKLKLQRPQNQQWAMDQRLWWELSPWIGGHKTWLILLRKDHGDPQALLFEKRRTFQRFLRGTINSSQKETLVLCKITQDKGIECCFIHEWTNDCIFRTESEDRKRLMMERISDLIQRSGIPPSEIW